MTPLPDTRESLLLRVGDSADGEAWREFAGIYRPAIYRLGRQRGLQDADAEDLAQRVLIVVADKIGQWRPTSGKGSFRAWLAAVARNAILNAVTRVQPDAARGGTSVLERLEQQSDRDDALARQYEEEQRRAVFRWAADQVRGEFRDTTWAAFWLTAVKGLAIDEAARRLNKSVGVVYAARSRVMRRLKQKVRDYDPMQAEQQAP